MNQPRYHALRIVGRAAAGCLIAATILGHACPALSAQAKTMDHDLAVRSKSIHWPSGFDPVKAELFAHNEGWISAHCSIVWEKIVDVSRWPSWYPNSRDIVLDGEVPVITSQSRWKWKTFGFDVESNVNEFVVNSRLAWYGNVPGKPRAFYHVWSLKPASGGCQVVTEEAAVGPDAAQLRKSNESLLHRGHELWIATLKWVSEQ